MSSRQTPHLHLVMADWLETSLESGERSLLLLAFRGAGKSTLVGLFCAWLLLRDSALRILVLAAEHSLASKMTRYIRQSIERHPLTAHLRGAIGKQLWAYDQVTVCRQQDEQRSVFIGKGHECECDGQSSRCDYL